jgi:hypothetical protein
VREAEAEITRASRDLVEAQQIAATPVNPADFAVSGPFIPFIQAKQDLKVPGLRKKAPKWRWRLKEDAIKQAVPEGEPISRTALRFPHLIPDELWVLDEKAVNGIVDRMKSRTSLHAIEAYDENA